MNICAWKKILVRAEGNKGILRERIFEIRANKNRKAKIKAGMCPMCGAALMLRNGTDGMFYGCGSFPKCKFTEQVR